MDNKEYGNNNVGNSFLEALAEGGFQVGELAKIYHPGGIEITVLDKDEAVAQTQALMTQEDVTIYEAAFKYENLFIKADVVIKKGQFVELVEVKSKSFDPSAEDPFYNKAKLKKGEAQLNSEWEPYLVDVAFQTHVLKLAYPMFKIRSTLMLADKSATANVEGLNQKFFLKKVEGEHISVAVAPHTTKESVGAPLLVKVSVDDEVKIVWGMTFENGKSFDQMVELLSEVCHDGRFVTPQVDSKCKSCEFRIGKDAKAKGAKSGFENCWSVAAQLKSSDFDKPLVFDIWNFKKTQSLLDQRKILIADVVEDDISPTSKADEPGLSSSERQWKQIEKIQLNESTPYLDYQGLWAEMKTWNYPLHFIDFETTMAAIPFNKGRRPYEQMAFQFSHHVVQQDGTIAHKDEYINLQRGKFPNFDFLRALKKSLSGDEGTIFRYAAHENTVLCQIREQILNSDEEISDGTELLTFIEGITKSSSGSKKVWLGRRNMIDMCELVKKYFYHPLTGGSNSIKKVLPAILNESIYLQEKYSQPVYGTKAMQSRNFKDWVWVEKGPLGSVVDPYKRLPPVFSDLDLETMDALITDGSIADGGAAMTAYARMQFTEMSDGEVERVSTALLKYCELDTFAMVLIFQYWQHEINVALNREAA